MNRKSVAPLRIILHSRLTVFITEIYPKSNRKTVVNSDPVAFFLMMGEGVQDDKYLLFRVKRLVKMTEYGKINIEFKLDQ